MDQAAPLLSIQFTGKADLLPPEDNPFHTSLHALVTGGNLSGTVSIDVLRCFTAKPRRHAGYRVHSPEKSCVPVTWRNTEGTNIRLAIRCRNPQEAVTTYQAFIAFLRSTASRKEHPMPSNGTTALQAILADDGAPPASVEPTQMELQPMPDAPDELMPAAFVANPDLVARFLELMQQKAEADGWTRTHACVQILRDEIGVRSGGKNTRGYTALYQLANTGVLERNTDLGYRVAKSGQVVVRETVMQADEPPLAVPAAPQPRHQSLIGRVAALRTRTANARALRKEKDVLESEVAEIDVQLASLAERKTQIQGQVAEIDTQLQQPKLQEDLAAYTEILRIIGENDA